MKKMIEAFQCGLPNRQKGFFLKKLLFLCMTIPMLAVITTGLPEKDRLIIPEKPYFGQTAPAAAAEIFAAGVISTGLEESVVTFMPDGSADIYRIDSKIFEALKAGGENK